MMMMIMQVLFLHRRQRFETVDTSNFCVNRQYKIFCEDADIDLQYRRLLEHSCKLCLSIEPFRSFQHLREHMQREHTLFYCDLCVNNLKVLRHVVDLLSDDCTARQWSCKWIVLQSTSLVTSIQRDGWYRPFQNHGAYAPKIADRSRALRMRARIHCNLLQLMWAL